SFTFHVTPIADVATCSVTWHWTDAPAAIDAWQRWAPVVDQRLVAELTLTAGSPGSIELAGWFTGTTTELRGLLAPLVSAVPPCSVHVGTTPYLDLVAPVAASGSPRAHALFKNTSTLAYDLLSASGIATLIDHLSMPLPPGVNQAQLFPFGGAIAAIDPAATAFVHRRALFDLQYQAYWWDPAHEADHVAWVRAFRLAMLPHTHGAYVNYIDGDDVDWAVDYYGTNLAQLKVVKAAYDPDNVFTGPQSVPL
ncbi:MAG TPA: BBE domain-containing protein, partial [Thermomicrobiales bacterium]|nr:BBE domain-containing protein [Thermomicrobiales bacterium]